MFENRKIVDKELVVCLDMMSEYLIVMIKDNFLINDFILIFYYVEGKIGVY